MRSNSSITKQLSQLTNIDYKLFVDYCYYLDKGMRKVALQYLDKFLELVELWDTSMKIKFCKTIFSHSQLDNDFEIILTKNLCEKLVEQTLLEMTKTNSTDFSAFKWYGQYFNHLDYLKKAFELNPIDVSTKQILVAKLEKELWLSTHHLPDSYIGDFESDMKNIELGLSICETFDDNHKHDLIARFKDYKKQIELVVN